MTTTATAEATEITLGGWICTGRFVATCKGCKTYVKVEREPRAIYSYFGDTCRECGRGIEMIQVMGSRDASKPCDGRCLNAKGHDCECSCGGANHGANR